MIGIIIARHTNFRYSCNDAKRWNKQLRFKSGVLKFLTHVPKTKSITIETADNTKKIRYTRYKYIVLWEKLKEKHNEDAEVSFEHN